MKDKTKEILYRIILPYAKICAGVIVVNGMIVKAAPVFKWSIGKKIQNFILWVDKKDGVIKKS